jgi:hypothetical protein
MLSTNSTEKTASWKGIQKRDGYTRSAGLGWSVICGIDSVVAGFKSVVYFAPVADIARGAGSLSGRVAPRLAMVAISLRSTAQLTGRYRPRFSENVVHSVHRSAMVEVPHCVRDLATHGALRFPFGTA